MFFMSNPNIRMNPDIEADITCINAKRGIFTACFGNVIINFNKFRSKLGIFNLFKDTGFN